MITPNKNDAVGCGVVLVTTLTDPVRNAFNAPPGTNRSHLRNCQPSHDPLSLRSVARTDLA
jgi:hypothetical protein